jgi:membrane fusion protein (multidrug efflux system)
MNSKGMVIKPGLALSLLALLAGCIDSPPPEINQAVPATPKSIEVSITTLQTQSWRGTVRSFGVIEALEEVDVAAELSGTVIAVHINEGDRVEEGQLLLELDAEKRRLAVNQAENEVEQAKAALDESRLRLERRRNLAQKDTISEEVLDNAQLSVDRASAAYQQAVAARQLAQRELADTRIISPIGGLVDILSVKAGEPVQAGAGLVSLQAVDALRVQTWVSEFDVSYLRAGSPVRVFPSALPGRDLSARIEWVGVAADKQTGNFPVKLVMSSGWEALRPGMTVSVEMEAEEISGALTLPEQAVVDYHRRRVVFVEENGVARVREPVLAAGLSNKLLVLSGLSAGDRVITQGQFRLVEGAPVHVRTAE